MSKISSLHKLVKLAMRRVGVTRDVFQKDAGIKKLSTALSVIDKALREGLIEPVSSSVDEGTTYKALEDGVKFDRQRRIKERMRDMARKEKQKKVAAPEEKAVVTTAFTSPHFSTVGVENPQPETAPVKEQAKPVGEPLVADKAALQSAGVDGSTRWNVEFKTLGEWAGELTEVMRRLAKSETAMPSDKETALRVRLKSAIEAAKDAEIAKLKADIDVQSARCELWKELVRLADEKASSYKEELRKLEAEIQTFRDVMKHLGCESGVAFVADFGGR